jgi:hypothetical protein
MENLGFFQDADRPEWQWFVALDGRTFVVTLYHQHDKVGTFRANSPSMIDSILSSFICDRGDR